MLNSPDNHHSQADLVSVDGSVVAAEDGLIGYIRQHAALAERSGYTIPADWRYQSQYHLLLALGRRHTPAPRPKSLTGMPARLCYSNAARYARDHHTQGLLYAEGFAATLDVYLSHAWTVRPDGCVIDPTWDDEPGRAYVGITVADPALWPYDGGGILQDFRRLPPLLRDGFPPNALADLGRPLTGPLPHE
ncbi:hypothetical protein ABZX38_32185 [Streptomyces longwoodensis]|uniref:hypothetical protein n=1 Tax=Streptomyces longwoodensis TaxID=68231 RepID=UPI0033B7B703